MWPHHSGSEEIEHYYEPETKEYFADSYDANEVKELINKAIKTLNNKEKTF